METLYTVLMALVAVAILVPMFSEVLGVSRKPSWACTVEQRVSLVVTEDRRTQALPFVGLDRRKSAQVEIELHKAA